VWLGRAAALAWPRGRTEAELSYSLAEAVAGSQLFRQAAARKSGAGAAAAAGFDRFDGSLLRGVRRLTSRNAVGPTNKEMRWGWGLLTEGRDGLVREGKPEQGKRTRTNKGPEMKGTFLMR